MTLPTIQDFREEEGLGDMTPKTGRMGPEAELVDNLKDLLRKRSQSLRSIIVRGIDEDGDPELASDLKQIVGMLGNLREMPQSEKEKTRDPLSNVVTRGLYGPDGPGAGMGGGSGEG